jgi:ferredoxin
MLRITRPSTVDWYNVDFPEVIAARRQLLPELATVFDIGADLTKPTWLDAVPNNRPAVIVADGLIAFLSEEELSALVSRLIDHFPKGQIAFNGYSKFAVWAQKRFSGADSIKDVTKFPGFDDPRHPESWDRRLMLRKEILCTREPEVAAFPLGLRLAGARRRDRRSRRHRRFLRGCRRQLVRRRCTCAGRRGRDRCHECIRRQSDSPARREGAVMRFRRQSEKCVGHAQCHAVDPETFPIDDDGYSTLTSRSVPDGELSGTDREGWRGRLSRVGADPRGRDVNRTVIAAVIGNRSAPRTACRCAPRAPLPRWVAATSSLHPRSPTVKARHWFRAPSPRRAARRPTTRPSRWCACAPRRTIPPAGARAFRERCRPTCPIRTSPVPPTRSPDRAAPQAFRRQGTAANQSGRCRSHSSQRHPAGG